MKLLFLRIVAVYLTVCGPAPAQTVVFTNFIRQHQMPSGLLWDATVAAAGEQLSALAIDPGGARFELWTIQDSPLKGYLLDTRYVGTYVPMVEVVLRSEDKSTTVPRTRADRPFYVDVTISGLLAGATDPVPSKSVKFLRHVQSYGAEGTGIGIDRAQAELLTQSLLTTNGVQQLTFLLSLVPGDDRAKVRGEERFSAFSLADYQAPESQLASQQIQIWPVADGTISGITQGHLIRFALPQVTLTLNDLYPNSTTYAQVYKGEPQLGVTGTIVPGSALSINDAAPQSRTLTLQGYDAVFDDDGRWTMELLTVTPFGMDRLAYVSFDLDRAINARGSVTTLE